MCRMSSHILLLLLFVVVGVTVAADFAQYLIFNTLHSSPLISFIQRQIFEHVTLTVSSNCPKKVDV